MLKLNYETAFGNVHSTVWCFIDTCSHSPLELALDEHVDTLTLPLLHHLLKPHKLNKG